MTMPTLTDIKDDTESILSRLSAPEGPSRIDLLNQRLADVAQLLETIQRQQLVLTTYVVKNLPSVNITWTEAEKHVTQQLAQRSKSP